MRLNVRVAGDCLSKVLLTACLLVLVAGVLLLLGVSMRLTPDTTASNGLPPRLQNDAHTSAVANARLRSKVELAHLPLSFEANQGQSDHQVKFLARGGGYTLFLTQNEAVLSLQSPIDKSQTLAQESRHSALSLQHSPTSASVIRMKLLGGEAHTAISGADELPSHSNYFIGNDPSKWRKDVPQYARVRYRRIYPGVDLVYYGNQGRLEYDFEVAPGADPNQIWLQIEGTKKLRIDASGNLLAETATGDVQLHAPEVYQKIDDQKRAVVGKFVLSAANQVRFAFGEYDRSRELVIDPVLNYSTYLGGSADEGCAFLTGTYTTAVSGCPAIAADAAGNIYIAGATTSIDFPPAGTPLQAHSTVPDVFVAKFIPNSTTVYALSYSTYLGGNASDTSAGIAVDSNRNIYIAGNTSSTDFPTTSNANQPTSSGGSHGFVSVINASGSALTYSTYVEGSGTDTISGLAIDTRANAYVTGITTSTTGFPITQGSIQPVPQTASPEFFLTELNTQPPASTSLMYSTYFGSTLPSSGAIVQGGGVAVDPFGFVYITGGTNFLTASQGGTFPILNAFRGCLNNPANTSPCPSPGTNPDAFVAKIDTAAAPGAQLKYSTYLGGTGSDTAYGIAVDSGGNAYITGSTDSTDFPIANTTNAFQSGNAGGTGTDVFVAKLGTGVPVPLSYSSYLGGTGNDIAYAIAVDANQGAHITGSTTSADFPQIDQISVTGPGAGPIDGFVALLQTTFVGHNGGYSSYLGGNAAAGNTDGTGIAVDANSNAYVAGETNSSTFPVTNGSALNGTASDTFVSKIVPTVTGLSMTPSTSITSGAVGIGNQVTFTYTIKNTGPDIATDLLFATVLPATGATFASASATPGSCTAVVNGTVICSLGSLGVGTQTQATVKINLTPTAAGTLTSTGTLQANGTPFTTQSASVTVADFTVGVSPSTNTVAAGNSATYQVQVGVPAGQTNFDPNQISLSCSAGVPTGASCTFSTSPVTLTNTSPVSSTLTITTTARPVTTGNLRNFRTWYAAVLPFAGLTFLGIGVGGDRSRKWLVTIFALLVFGLVGLQLACSGSSGTSTPPAGTPAGTYPITITGTSGSASHAVRMTLMVQ